MPPLRDLIKSTVANTHLSLDFFGEDVEFVPAETGVPRTVRMKIQEDEDASYVDAEGLNTRDSIDALMLRDESALDKDDVPLGGVSVLKFGDKLRRGVAADPEQRWYFFEGDLKHTTQVKQHATFVRVRSMTKNAGR